MVSPPSGPCLIMDWTKMEVRKHTYANILRLMLASAVAMAISASALPGAEDPVPSLSGPEAEMMDSIKQHLKGSLQDYQRSLHASYSKRSQEFERRVKRELLVTENVYWNMNAEMEIPTNFTIIKHFYVDGEDFIILGYNNASNGDYMLDAEIFRFDPATSSLTSTGVTVATHGLADIEPFLVSGTMYLAFANGQFSANDYQGLSQVWAFDPATPSLSHVQNIYTYGASSLEAFMYEGDTYLAITNARVNSYLRYMGSTKIYFFAGSYFDEIASVVTYAASDTSAATLGFDLYIAIAQRVDNDGDFAVGCLLYQLAIGTDDDSGIMTFEMVKKQVIPSSGPNSLSFFHHQGHAYLAVANQAQLVAGVETSQTDSIIYWWATDDQLLEYQTVATDGAMQFEYLELEFDPSLLALADLTGLRFYHFSEDALWIEADTALFEEVGEETSDVGIEFFNIDNVDYMATVGATFWTTDHRNLTASNMFSFMHVNETTTEYVNETEIYLPECVTNLTENAKERMKEASETKKDLDRGVSKTKDKQVINSDIILTGHVKIPVLHTKTLEIQDGQEYSLDPQLMESHRNNTRRIRTLESQAEGFVTKSTVQTIEGPVTMTSAKTTVTGATTADSFTTADGLVNEIDLPYIDGQALRDSGNQTMYDTVAFGSEITVCANVAVSGTVGGITVPDDVMDKPSMQTVNGSKTFTADVNFNADVTVDGDINDLDLDDVVQTGRNASVAGAKTFSQGITLQDTMEVAEGRTVDTVDISEFVYEVLTVSGGGTATGSNTFQNPVNMTGGVELGNGINDVDVIQLYSDAVFVDGDQTITARKHFTNDLQSDDDIVISGTVNGIDLSERVFRLSTAQTVDTQITVIGGTVSARENVVVMGTVNGIDLSEEAVLVNTTQTINGTVIFTEDIDIEGDIIVSPNALVNGVDISEYAATAVRINEDWQAISGVKIFTKLLRISGELTVSGLINGVDIEELYDDILSISRPQSFAVHVAVETPVGITGDATLQSTIDGLTIPDDLVGLGIHTDIYGNKTFSDILHITGDLTLDANINGEDLSAFATNILKKPGEQTVATLDITLSAASITGGLTVDGTINSYTVPDDFVLLDGNQTVTGTKTFDQVSLSVSGDVVTPDLEVEGDVDTVDIDLLYSDAIMEDDGGKCTIAGATTIATFEVEGSTTVSGTVDGVDLLTFNATAVFLAGNHEISGTKTFTSTVQFDEDVGVTNLVGAIDFSDEAALVIYKDTRGSVRGLKTFSNGVTVTGYLDIDGLINGVNITLLDEIYLSKEYEQALEEAKTFSELITLTTLVLSGGKELDGVDPADFLLLGSDEVLSAAVTFRQDVDVEGSLTVGGLINTVNITELESTAVWKTGPPQTVDGIKSFPSITVNGNIIVATGLVDGVDVSELSSRVLDSSVSNVISVDTVLSGPVTVTGDLDTEAKTGGVNISFLLDDAIVLSEDFNITGTFGFGSSADVTMTNLVFQDDLELTVQLDQTLLRDFMTSAVRMSTDQNITGSIVFDEDIILLSCLDIAGLTDDIDLSEHAVLKAGNQTISGCTRFSSGFRVNADITVGGDVDGVDLAALLAARVTYSMSQEITGTWVFSNLTAEGNISVDGTLNSIDVGGDLVTTYANEVITGKKDFVSDIDVVQDLETAEINGVDIVELSTKVVLTEGAFDIAGAKTFRSLLTMEADTDVTGLVNCVDVGLLRSTLDTVTGAFNSSLDGLGDSLRSQCVATATMQSSVGEHPLLVTHWNDLQDIDNPAAGNFHSTTLEGGDTLLGLAETYQSAVDRCIVTRLYLCPIDWPTCFPVLDEPLPGAHDVHLYPYDGDVFIVLLPSQQSGLCVDAHDKEISVTTILKLRDPAFNTSLDTPHALGATMFEIGERLFLAIADYQDTNTHSTDVNSTIFVFNNATGHFELFQRILTHSAFGVSHLQWGEYTWLCFANNHLDRKSPIYVYDADADQFVEHVRQGTNHATAVSMFLVDDVPFATISSEKLIGDQREVEFHRELTVLSYDGSRWNQLESIEGYGIRDTAVFATDQFVYLVAVSMEAGILTIYEWHHAGMFEVVQELPFGNQYDAHIFIHNHEVLMALSRPAFTSANIFSWKSKIMKAVIRGKTNDTVLQAW